MALTCSRCRHELAAGAKFCGECGAPVELQTAAEAGRLAEKILASRAASERRSVTVLFANTKGSMELLADRDPVEGAQILGSIRERMMEAVHNYEGTVNQTMGDSIMALFGAPLVQDDHAVRACYAALRMQQSIKRYAVDARRMYGLNVQIRVGLNSGEILVQPIRADLLMEYTAVGHTTNLAARVERLATPGSILITPSTRALVTGYVSVRPLGPVALAGFPDSVDVYEVIGTASGDEPAEKG